MSAVGRADQYSRSARYIVDGSGVKTMTLAAAFLVERGAVPALAVVSFT